MASAATVSIDCVSFATEDVNKQDRSLLFRVPGEVRDRIFEYALLDYEDKGKSYDVNTYWSRPQYLASRRSDTALLRTCKQIYIETWFRPWTSALHTCWLTEPPRAPADREPFKHSKGFERKLATIYERHGYIELSHIRVFAQLWALEPGLHLSKILRVPHFYPRTLTITLRHSDFWFWERDEPLHVKADWVNQCRFPPSLREFRFELESLQRKQKQIDSLAEQMKNQWYFTRKDKVYLFANTKEADDVTLWQGSSVLNDERWLRDETTTPGKLDYYMRTIVWRADAARSTRGMKTPRQIHTQVRSPIITASHPSVSQTELKLAGVGLDVPAAEALAIWEAWKRR